VVKKWLAGLFGGTAAPRKAAAPNLLQPLNFGEDRLVFRLHFPLLRQGRSLRLQRRQTIS